MLTALVRSYFSELNSTIMNQPGVIDAKTIFSIKVNKSILKKQKHYVGRIFYEASSFVLLQSNEFCFSNSVKENVFFLCNFGG